MLVKVALVFLLVMALIAFVGRLLTGKPAPARRCRSCQRPLLGPGPCPCKGGR